MIQEELKNFIEQNCSGKEPSDLIMEAIGQKIEQLGADADEVLAFVEECAKGPTLEQKAEAARRAAEAEAERQARIAEAEAKAKSDAKNAELAAEKAKEALAEAEAARQKAEAEKARVSEMKHKHEVKKERKRMYTIIGIVALAILLGIGYFYMRTFTRKSVVDLASEAAYNSVSHERISDLDVDTSDVPSDDSSVTIDPNGDVKEQLEKYYDQVGDYKENFYKIKKGNLYGIADKEGKIIQRPKFDYIYSRNDKGLIKVEKDNKLGYLNIKGIIVIEPKYTSIEPEKDGLIKVEINKKYGFLNAETLQEVAECIYDHIYDLEDGKYKVGIGRQIGYLNADGSVSQVPQ